MSSRFGFTFAMRALILIAASKYAVSFCRSQQFWSYELMKTPGGEAAAVDRFHACGVVNRL